MDREMCQIEIMMNAFAVDPLKLPPLLTAHCSLPMAQWLQLCVEVD